jgi:hypothetical protein
LKTREERILERTGAASALSTHSQANPRPCAAARLPPRTVHKLDMGAAMRSGDGHVGVGRHVGAEIP